MVIDIGLEMAQHTVLVLCMGLVMRLGIWLVMVLVMGMAQRMGLIMCIGMSTVVGIAILMAMNMGTKTTTE